MVEKEYRWKFLEVGLKSNHDGSTWTIGKWRKVAPPMQECVGLNACRYIQDALSYVQEPILALVEIGGKIISSDDKDTCERMRIVKTWKWTKKNSVALAIYSAEICLLDYEKLYPDDKRIRDAIEKARAVLKTDTEKNRSAASAARGAAESAASAARGEAESAAWSAARGAAKEKIHAYILKIKRIKA